MFVRAELMLEFQVVVRLLSSVFFTALFFIPITVNAIESKVQSDENYSATQFFKAIPEQYLKVYSLAPKPDERGALDRNRDYFLSIEFQVSAYDLIVYGVAVSDEEYIYQGLLALEHGFLNEDKLGGFRTADQGGIKPKIGDRVSGAALFCAVVAMSYTLLRDSEYANQYKAELDALLLNVANTMKWLNKHQDILIRSAIDSSHRFAIGALTFVLNGELLNQPRYIEFGEVLLDQAFKIQRRNGVFIEKDGHDSSYQAVSMLMLQYLAIFSHNPRYKTMIGEPVKLGMYWEKTRIKQDGSVLATGNTRTGLGQEHFFGEPKALKYSSIIKALVIYAGLYGDVGKWQIATSVMSYIRAGQEI